MTAWIWKRFDLCAAVNKDVNTVHAGEAPAAIAAKKVELLASQEVSGGDVVVGELSIDEGRTFSTVVLVEDAIARWVLRHDVALPEMLPKGGYVIRSEEGARV